MNPTMLVEPADTVVLLPSRTRYEQRGGGTETSTERRVIYSPEIPGPRPGEARDEWEIPVHGGAQVRSGARRASLPVARHAGHSQRNRPRLPHLQGHRQVCGRKATSFQYGGPRLLADRFLTPDGMGHF